jgi:hypothetical protein
MNSTRVNLKFKCLLPEIKEPYIVKTSIKDYKWFKEALKDLNKNKHKVKTHTARCPGIINYLNYGWVQKTYQDIIIKTNGDKETIMYSTPFKQEESKFGKYIGAYVHYHSADELYKYQKFREDCIKPLVKIHSPYIVEVPKGCWLLRLPLAYPDDNRFTAAIGFLDGKNFLNVQLFWHRLNSEEYIKRGTPLCQYVLVPKCEIKTTLEKGNLKDILDTGLFNE